MTYRITYEVRESYLFVKLEGPESYASAIHFWETLAEKSKLEAINNILIKDEVQGRLTTIELHHLSELVSRLFRGKKIAYIDEKEATFEDNKFGETVILNRGGIVKLFKSEAEGQEWVTRGT
ncbi:MAG: hypothetical protein L3J79_11405 [Candidatus Marinimicrobia bacterium]|nr:hypothetical protein [Candidatus Neomarinimicrobiota bacterium]